MGLLPEHDPEKCGAVFRQDHAQSRGSYPVAMALSRHPSSQRVDRRRPAAIFRPLREAGFGRPKAPVAELVDALDSKSSSARSAGSIPARGTKLRRFAATLGAAKLTLSWRSGEACPAKPLGEDGQIFRGYAWRGPAGQINYFGFGAAGALQAVAPKGTFGQFQPNTPPFESVHSRVADFDPSLPASSRRRPAVEASGEGAACAAWREVFGGIMAFTKWFEITKPPAASRMIEQPRNDLPDRIRVFLIPFHCRYGPRHPLPKPDHIRSFDARIKSAHVSARLSK
jgi:hypothetical protein